MLVAIFFRVNVVIQSNVRRVFASSRVRFLNLKICSGFDATDRRAEFAIISLIYPIVDVGSIPCYIVVN